MIRNFFLNICYNEDDANLLQFMKRNIAIIVVVLCLALLLTFGQAQRGGGSSRSSSSGSHGSSKNSHSWSRSGKKQRSDIDLLTVLGFNPQKSAKLSSNQITKMWFIRIIFAALGMYLLYSGYTTNLDNKIYFKVRDILLRFRYKKNREPPTMSKKQCEAFVESMKSKVFNMTFWQNDKEKSFSCRLDFSLIFKISQILYEISFKGTDDFGCFKMEGTLVLTKVGIEMMLLKKYGDVAANGQTGTFKHLLYEGSGSIGQCQGTWTYVGHQKEDKYHGTWAMISKNAE